MAEPDSSTVGPLVAAGDRLGDERRADGPALDELALVVVGPSVIGDARSGEVDDGIDVVERSRRRSARRPDLQEMSGRPPMPDRTHAGHVVADASRRCGTSAEPTRPVAPVTAIRIASSVRLVPTLSAQPVAAD